jgi:hypothetical protein
MGGGQVVPDRATVTTRRLFVLVLFSAIFAMAVRETLDPDMWWHLRAGELIWQSGVPTADTFSFTVPGKEWFAHEWLTEALMWQVYRLGGLPGLSLFFAGLVTAAYGLVYQASPGRPYVAGFVVLLAALASLFFWGVRAQVVTMLLAAAFIFVLEGFRAGRFGRRALLALPALTVIWANLHSGYLLGVGLIAAYAAGEAAERLLARNKRGEGAAGDIRWLALVAGACLLAAALNPRGFALWVYPFLTLGSASMQAYIGEWQSPDFHDRLFWLFGPYLAVLFLSHVLSSKRPTVTEILLVLGGTAAAFLSARHIPLFTLLTAPLITHQAMGLLEGSRWYPTLAGTAAARPARVATLVNLAALVFVLLGAGLWIVQRLLNNEPAIAANYPAAAVAHLGPEVLAQRRGFNHYAWGGYLIWQGIPVYVDGRADLYGDNFLVDYLEVGAAGDGWAQQLAAHGVDYVLLPPTADLGRYLETDPGWVRSYTDAIAHVYVRSDE